MIAGKFTKYTPTNEKLLEDAQFIKNNTGMDIIFLRTEQGDDWYKCNHVFTRHYKNSI